MSGLDGWGDARAAAAALGAGGRDAVRLADLAVAQVAAEARGLRADDVAGFPLPPLRPDRRAWRQLRAAAEPIAEQLAVGRELHAWSAASQAADGGRKGMGAYGTPPALANELVRAALGPLSDRPALSVCDPSAGHGALLAASFELLVLQGRAPAEAARSLHGVELDPHAWELGTLIVWLAGPGEAGVGIDELRTRIVCGNALTANPHRSAFDAVVMNPPWESLRQRPAVPTGERAEREATRRRLSTVEGAGREGLPALYSSQGRGDRNLYKGFVELAPHLLRESGRLGALLPAAFASDLGTRPLRELYLEHMAVEQWTTFENLERYFPIDSRYKFGILVAERSSQGTGPIRIRSLARSAVEVRAPHLELSRRDVAHLGGPAAMIPELSSERELAVLRQAFRAGTPFFAAGGSFGAVRYRRELDLTLDRAAGRFRHLDGCRRAGYEPRGDGAWAAGSDVLVPLVEGRMVAAFDFFQKSWRSGGGRTARWQRNGEAGLDACRPQFLVERLDGAGPRLAICDVTSATNTRTMLATWVPPWPCGNTAPVLELEDHEASLALLAVLNSMTFDWILRRIVAGLHLNRFYLEATPLPRLEPGPLARLAAFGGAMTNRSPRVASLRDRDRAGLPAASLEECGTSAAEAESEVARGYGLSPDQLAFVLDGDPAERKGLWRYFASAPEALQVARESVELLRAA